MWKDSINVQLIKFSPSHIQIVVKSIDGPQWLFTSIYDHFETAKRGKTWHLMNTLKPMDGVPLLVGGDFNKIVAQHEKNGGNLRSKHQIKDFQSILDYCQIQDLDFVGNIYTWCKGVMEVRELAGVWIAMLLI